jgi:CRISPR system Cascade subunit CasD
MAKAEGTAMPSFLILKLDGPMQAWGDHTFEDFRPSRDFPTRSGLLGMLAACLGIEREDAEAQARLAGSVDFAVRVDGSKFGLESGATPLSRRAIKLKDYHTVLEARRANRPPKPRETIQTWREYLHNAHFTVAVGQRELAAYTLETIAGHLRKPVYTPSLGRRSCPLARPLLDSENALVSAASSIEALGIAPPVGGMIYAEICSGDGKPMIVRDVPMHRRKRQFATRKVYVRKEQETTHVRQPD